MTILVDARPLVDTDSRGVAAVVFDWLMRMVEEKDVSFVFVTTGWHIPTLPHPFKTHARVTHAHIRIPNKCWTALSILRIASLDRAAAKKTGLHFDKLLIGNLGFTGRITVPYTLLLHDVSFLIEPKWFSFKSRVWHNAVQCRRLIQNAEKLVCVSETTKRDVERIIGARGAGRGAREEKNIQIFTPRIRPSERQTNNDKRQTNNTPFLLALGGGNARKNIPTIVTALTRLRMEPRYANLELVIIGAPKREMSSFRITKDEQRTNFSWTSTLPHVSNLELDQLYATAACFLYPSWYEGYGLPLHEASRLGCPCIASSAGALPETAPEGTIFVPPSKPHLWVSAIRDMLDHTGE